jgi:hypothetical protein
MQIEIVQDSKGNDIILGKGRQKVVYLGKLYIKNTTIYVAITNFPPWKVLIGHNKPHIFQLLIKNDINGFYVMELGIYLSVGIEQDLYLKYPRFTKDIFIRIMSQKIISAFEAADLGLTTYDVCAEFIVVPSDNYRIKIIDLDLSQPKRTPTKYDMCIQSLYIIIGSSITSKNPCPLDLVSNIDTYEGPKDNILMFVHDFFCLVCDKYKIKINKKNIIPKNLETNFRYTTISAIVFFLENRIFTNQYYFNNFFGHLEV